MYLIPVAVDTSPTTGRKKLILAGLWTEVCIAMPAIQAIEDGYEVYIVADACGGLRV
jgi:nicotinamidase-related amidase